MTMRPIHTTRVWKRGILPSLRERLFGERDVVADQLHGLARQGTWMARLAHVCAFAMLVLFSLGSLVGIAGDSATIFVTAWQRGQLDLVHGLAAGVSAAFVLCMDVASLSAALTLRIHAARQAPWRTRLVHIGVIALADVLEAGTIAYMTWRYDPSSIGLVWALVLARDIAAPLYAVYLSLAQPLPVGARDVLHMVEMAAGAGMARDALRIANDPVAPLERKARLFVAASETANRTTRQDLERLWYLLQVLTTTTDAEASGMAIGTRPQAEGEGNTRGDIGAGMADQALPEPHPAPAPHRPLRGRHRGEHNASASQQPPRRARQLHQSDELALSPRYRHGRDTPDGEAEDGFERDRAPAPAPVGFQQPHANVRTPRQIEGDRAPATEDEEDEETFLRADTGMSQAIRVVLNERREAAARQILSNESVISVRTFARRVEEATRNKISESTAQALMSRVRAALMHEAEAAQQARQLGQLPPLADVFAE